MFVWNDREEKMISSFILMPALMGVRIKCIMQTLKLQKNVEILSILC